VIVLAPPPPARVQVVAQEFSFALSRQSIKAGWATIELRNAGQDAHDLRMRRVGGARVYAWPVTRAGGVRDETFRLLPGRYVLYCSVANHRALGMSATLVVRPRGG
jgi:plastocyanin